MASKLSDTKRHLVGELPEYLKIPRVQLQPVLAKEGKPNIDMKLLSNRLSDVAVLRSMISVKSPGHWTEIISNLDEDIDGIIPVSIPAYPTEIWNSHPQPLVNRNLPFIFWSLLEFDEPDFWRWSAVDFLKTLGVEAILVKNHNYGITYLKALAMRRFLKTSKLVVFGEQNFPWNVPAAAHLFTESLGTKFVVRDISDYRKISKTFSDELVKKVWNERKHRYIEKSVQPEMLKESVRIYLAIKSILEEEKALGFGVNCYGDLIINGGRDVPCLAQTLLREDGYIASCDGDYVTMMGMVLSTYFLEKTCMMSNMYPLWYEGALREHFGGDPLLPDENKYPGNLWNNFARLAHCGYVGVISPEMDPGGRTVLNDWGGTWEIKRDGRGCGNAGKLAEGETMTGVQLKFDGKTLLLAEVECVETTSHKGMPHCELSALLKFRDLKGFVDNISREHLSFVYGNHIEDLKILAKVLNLNCIVF